MSTDLFTVAKLDLPRRRRGRRFAGLAGPSNRLSSSRRSAASRKMDIGAIASSA